MDSTVTDRARLFVALDPPEEIRERIGAWQDQVASPELRPAAGEALHLTLAFLGERPVEEIGALGQLVESIPAEPVVGRLETNPIPVPRRRPRLWALAIDSPDAGRLQATLAERLSALDLPGYAPEEQAFWPHLTVFRVRDGNRGGRRGSALPELTHPLPGRDGHAFGFVRVALYRSRPRPEGSRYSRLAAIELPHSGGPQKR